MAVDLHPLPLLEMPNPPINQELQSTSQSSLPDIEGRTSDQQEVDTSQLLDGLDQELSPRITALQSESDVAS